MLWNKAYEWPDMGRHRRNVGPIVGDFTPLLHALTTLNQFIADSIDKGIMIRLMKAQDMARCSVRVTVGHMMTHINTTSACGVPPSNMIDRGLPARNGTLSTYTR